LYSLNGPTFIARFMALLKVRRRNWRVWSHFYNLFGDEFKYITDFLCVFVS
jgi:hypothetical protein